MAGSVGLAYGRHELEVTLPDEAVVDVIRKQPQAALADPAAAVRAALAEPVGSPPLADLARGRRSACIVVCDITRPVPNGLFLRPMIETMIGAGIPAEAIVVVVATGLHRACLGSELDEVIGDPWVTEHVRVINHDARDDAAMVDLGTTSSGVPIMINRLLVEADLRIVTGLVEPHFMAGWSGGRKVVAPGVAGHETIRTFHSARFMADPLAVQGNLAGNPLHEAQLEIVARLGETYAVNTVLSDDRGLVHVNFGEVVASHAAAVEQAAAGSVVRVPQRYATVVTSAAGYPLDKTYYQTVKGMVLPLGILAPGGTVIIASACSEGLGSPEFADAQRRLVESGTEAFLASLHAKSLADIDEWQTQMQLKPMQAGRVQLYTDGLSPTDAALTGVDHVGSVGEAIRASIERTGDPRVAIIPEGPYVLPVVG